jgi:hypothetical protein
MLKHARRTTHQRQRTSLLLLLLLGMTATSCSGMQGRRALQDLAIYLASDPAISLVTC